MPLFVSITGSLKEVFFSDFHFGKKSLAFFINFGKFIKELKVKAGTFDPPLERRLDVTWRKKVSSYLQPGPHWKDGD